MTEVPGERSPDLAERIATGVLTHPSVVRLDGGPLGTVATHLPGRRVLGVRVTEAEPEDGAGTVPGAGTGLPAGVQISVVLRLGERLPQVSAELRNLVRDLAGAVPVDVTVTDVVVTEPPIQPAPARPRVR